MLAAFYQKEMIEAGCDEAGRGCLAGPVVAAAVILPIDYSNTSLNDSKKLSARKRTQLKEEIINDALAWAIGIAEPDEIDSINILNASFLAMHRAINGLKIKPGFLLIDGNRFNPYPGMPHKCLVKGDSRFQSIAAASILAKTYRDALMLHFHSEFPIYNWQSNKGYPTADHRAAILDHGVCRLHRNSFQLLPKQLKIAI